MFIYYWKPNLVGFMVQRLIRFVKKFIYGPKRVVADDIANAGKSRLGRSHALLRVQRHRRSKHAAHSISGISKYNYSTVRSLLSSKLAKTKSGNAERQQSLYSAA